MAAARSRTTVPVGSKQWILGERDHISQFEDQENEDFAFSARNEFDWLNEHMAEIFSNSQVNVTEIFKTPGKLRGKTPRTARKRNALETRAPLTDVFASDIRYNGTPSQRPGKGGKKLRIQSPLPTEVSQHATATVANNAHLGLQEPAADDMEVDIVQVEQRTDGQQVVPASMDLDTEDQDGKPSEGSTGDSFSSAREKVTMKEDPQPSNSIPGAFPRDTPVPADDPSTNPSNTMRPEKADAMDIDEQHVTKAVDEEPLDASPSVSDTSSPEKAIVRKSSLTFASLPAREPLATKKSIGKRDSKINGADPRSGAFSSSYFGRFTGGKSLGFARQQEDDDMDLDDTQAQDESEDDTKTVKLHNKSSTQRLHERINLLGKTPAPRPTKSVPSAAAATSQEQPAYPDLPKHSEQVGNTAATEATELSRPTHVHIVPDEDDDWIVPPANDNAARPQLTKSRSVDVMEKINGKESIGGERLGFAPEEKESAKLMSPTRMDTIRESGQHLYQHQKSVSTTVLPTYPYEQDDANWKLISVSNPTISGAESTTPAGSPSRLHLEGHLSASKSKLQSIMKSARGLFTSSAGVSAQAKMEALSPSSSRIRVGGIDEIMNMPERSTEALPQFQDDAHSMNSDVPGKSRKPRNSMDKEDKKKEREARDREKAEAELAKARDRERQKAKDFKEKEDARAAAKNATVARSLENTSKPVRQSPRRLDKEEEEKNAKSQFESRPASQMAASSKSAFQTSTTKKPTEVRRPIKPTPKPAAKPPQVAIRVGTMSQRIPLTNSALSSSLQDSLPPASTKQPGLSKKPSNASIQTTASTASFKSSTSGASKPKSLVIAAQKKEQAEKEAQRKEDEKREREKKRAAAQEEAQRKEREQRQREEAERQREKREEAERQRERREEAERQREREAVAAEEAKRKAQKAAADQKRSEMSKKTQAELAKKVQQHQQPEKRAANELNNALNDEKSQPSNASRADPGNTRPPSRSERLEDFPKPPSRPINPAKAPIKRIFDPDNDDELSRPARPTGAFNYQQSQDKRRRTEEEDTHTSGSRPTLQPPIRLSNMRKMQPGVSQAQAGPMHKPNTMNTSWQQQPQQHHYSTQPNRPANHPIDMAKYQSGKIPFADQAQQQTQQTMSMQQQTTTTTYKTPLATSKTTFASTTKTTRSSPGFGTNGDHIHLDEIQTESEEEDSEDERRKKRSLPDWVRTPVLFEQLGAQERLNPDAVFGPIAPLNMEEMFRDKSRHNKFRARTSSANWTGSDRLTEDDIRNDNAAREKLRRDGAWSFRLGES